MVIRVPGANAVIEASLRQWIQPPQPVRITRDLPVAIDLHDAAQLPVRGSGSIVVNRPVGNGPAEIHVTAFIHRTNQLKVPQSPLKLRIKMRERLRIIPHVRA